MSNIWPVGQIWPGEVGHLAHGAFCRLDHPSLRAGFGSRGSSPWLQQPLPWWHKSLLLQQGSWTPGVDTTCPRPLRSLTCLGNELPLLGKSGSGINFLGSGARLNQWLQQPRGLLVLLLLAGHLAHGKPCSLHLTCDELRGLDPTHEFDPLQCKWVHKVQWFRVCLHCVLGATIYTCYTRMLHTSCSQACRGSGFRSRHRGIPLGWLHYWISGLVHANERG